MNRFLLMLIGGWFTALMSCPATPPSSPPLLALDTVHEADGARHHHIEGPEELADRPVGMASTFKVVLAWVALEEGCVSLTDRRPVSDRHVPRAPRAINLQEAMFYSSNDFFIGLLNEKAMRQLPAYLQRAGLADTLPANWLAEGPQAIARGGSLRVTPRQNHQFLLRLALGQLTSSPQIQNDVEQACLWPPREGPLSVHGKTGVWGGAVWFNGWARSPDGRLHVRTVFTPGNVSRRPLAIRSFYHGIGLQWSDSWSTWLDIPSSPPSLQPQP